MNIYVLFESDFCNTLFNILAMKYIYLFLLLFLFSCNRTKSVDSNLQTINVDLNNLDEQKAAFANFSIVKLETTDESLLMDVAKVICTSDRIYVLSMLESTVFIFDRSGKFIYKFPKGEGPGEFTFVSDIQVYQGKLYILEGYRTINEYELDGKYIKKYMAFDDPYFLFNLVPEGIVLLDPNINKRSDFNVHYKTKNGQEYTCFPKNKWLKDAGIITYTFMRDNYITWPLSNLVYQLQQDGNMIPVYNIDFGGKWIDAQDFKSAITNEDMCGGALKQYANWLKDFIPLQNGGAFFGFKMDKDYFVKYENGIPNLYSTLLKGLPDMKNAAVGSLKDSLIYTYSVGQLNDYKKEHKIENNADLQNLYKYAEDENANPVLVFVGVNGD